MGAEEGLVKAEGPVASTTEPPAIAVEEGAVAQGGLSLVIAEADETFLLQETERPNDVASVLAFSEGGDPICGDFVTQPLEYIQTTPNFAVVESFEIGWENHLCLEPYGGEGDRIWGMEVVAPDGSLIARREYDPEKFVGPGESGVEEFPLPSERPGDPGSIEFAAAQINLSPEIGVMRGVYRITVWTDLVRYDRSVEMTLPSEPRLVLRTPEQVGVESGAPLVAVFFSFPNNPIPASFYRCKTDSNQYEFQSMIEVEQDSSGIGYLAVSPPPGTCLALAGDPAATLRVDGDGVGLSGLGNAPAVRFGQ